MCKADITDAFKLIPIKPEQWHLFGIKWNSKYYFYHRLAFGCRSSPKIFDQLSEAICWILQQNYNISIIFHLLDDFLTIDKPQDCAEPTMAILCTVFKRLNIPLAMHKILGPTTMLEYLGIILDSMHMKARLPLDKVQRIHEFLCTMSSRKSCTQRELLLLLGHLNFASQVIRPGKSLVSYLIFLSTTVKKLHHHVYLSKDCREDIHMWTNGMVSLCSSTSMLQPLMTYNYSLMHPPLLALEPFTKVSGLQKHGPFVCCSILQVPQSDHVHGLYGTVSYCSSVKSLGISLVWQKNSIQLR